MIPYSGDFAEDTTVYLMFNTFTSDDPSASSTITNFINTDVHIHKDDGLVQRNNAAGITVSIDFDGITGSHMIKIDTNDNTVADFWVTGSDYFVRIEGTTVDGATINAVVGSFSIENRYNPVTDYDGPTNAEMVAAFTEIKGGTWAAGTDTLEHIRDKQTDIETDTAVIGALGAGLTAIPWNSAWDAEMESECKDALEAMHLDHLLAADYDPAAKPGVATALLNELIESNAGVSRLTTNALEQAKGTNNAALATGLATHDGKLDTVDTVADGIQTDLSNATDGLGALKVLIDTINGIVDSILVDTGTTLDGIVDAILVDTNELQTDWVNGGRLDLLIDAIKAKTDNQPAGVPKNVALSNFMFLMMDSTDHITPITGRTVVEEISKDGAAFAACTNAFAEVSNGMYKINFTQAEMNADVVVLRFTAAGADDRLITILTSS